MKKYILTTGCSFTNNIRLNPDNINGDTSPNLYSWPYFLQKELGEEYIVLNYGAATNDNVSMCRILLYHIDRLVNEGVDTSNITIITQWSDPTRQSIYLQKQMDTEHHHMGHTLVYHNNWTTIPGLFYLTGGFSPPTGPDSAIEWLGIEKAIQYWELDINWNNIINQTMHWLELWILLENTCRELGIKTYYMSMRNPFSKEAKECFFGAPDNNSDIPTKTIWFEDYEVLRPYINKLPINSKNYWHHKNYNGLLEWAIDNVNDEKYPLFQEYLGNNVDNYIDYLKIQPNGWGHPSAQLMEIFVKTELVDLIRK